jgi:enoyl-CoA hydratase
VYKQLLYDINHNEGYVKITLNRPEKRNAISIDLAEELNRALTQASKEENIKFLILTGVGEKAFCSGGDLHDFHGEITEEEVEVILGKVQRVLYQLVAFPLPTICLLNGDSRGGGSELATACDIRLAKAGTYHGFVQGKLGIIPGFGGGALLHTRIAPAQALYWLTTSENYPSETLQQWGWIQNIYANDNEEKALLLPFIEKKVNQMRLFKQQLLMHPQLKDIKTDMEREVHNCAAIWNSDEHKLALDSFWSKRRKK